MTRQQKLNLTSITSGAVAVIVALTTLIAEIRSWRREAAQWEYSRSIHKAVGPEVNANLPADWPDSTAKE